MSCRAASDQAGPERARRTREPLGREDDRDDGDSLDRVPLEIAVAPPPHVQLELLDPRLGPREEERLRLRFSPEDELDFRRLRAADLVDEHAGPDGERDHRNAERRRTAPSAGASPSRLPRVPTRTTSRGISGRRRDSAQATFARTSFAMA